MYCRLVSPPVPKPTKRGRRRGEPVSRDAVLTAATHRFARDGYEKATLRAIADDARVDPSMVLYLFGSKADLFRESLRLIIDADVLVAAMTDGEGDVGTRLARTYLHIWESPATGPTMQAMFKAAMSNSDAHEAFRTFLRDYVVTEVSGTLGVGEQSRLRATLAGSNLVGTAVLRYVMKVPPLATLPAEEVVRMIAPTITRYLTADAEDLGLPTL